MIRNLNKIEMLNLLNKLLKRYDYAVYEGDVLKVTMRRLKLYKEYSYFDGLNLDL